MCFSALSIGDKIGNFKVGKQFDALHIDLASCDSPVHLFPGEKLLDMVEKFIMLGDDRNIVQVFVDGKNVKVSHQPLLT
jgi:guanine deaminase